MRNFGLILLIVGFFLLVTVGVFSVVASFLNREFVDIYRPLPPPTFERTVVADEKFAEMEEREVEDTYAMGLRTGDVAKAMSDFEEGRKKSSSEDRELLLDARDHLLRVVGEYQDDELTPDATLYLGRVLVRLEDWAAAKEQLATINKNKDWLDREERAESRFLYGLSLEKLGKTDDAIKVYNATIAVYGEYAEWSLQSLSHGFELAYSSDDPKMKLKSYRYLKKLLYMFQNFEGGGSLEDLHQRKGEVEVELGITEDQERAIDRELGIKWVEMVRDEERIWVLNKVGWGILTIVGLLTIFSARGKSKRFWRYYLALFLVSVMAALAYWSSAEMMKIIHLEQANSLHSSGFYDELVANGKIFHRKLSFAIQSLTVFFVMMLVLVFRKANITK